MDINPIVSAMEFLDLSDANDDEKAEAMAIIGSAPVYGVEFPFDFKTSTDLSEMRECVNSLSRTEISEQELSQGVVELRHFNETPNHLRKPSPTHEFVESHSSEQIPQTSSSLPQWEMNVSTVGPVVCGPPQYIYHQTPPHYYPTNAPMSGHYYNPVANGAINMNSPKELNKMRSSGSHNPNKSKGVHSPDIRAPFYPPHNQYSDVPQLIDNIRAPPPIVTDGIMALTNGPPVQPMFTPGFPPQFLPHPHSPFPVQQMYIIATPEGSYLTYGLPPPGVQMTRPSTPPSVPNVVTDDISAITSNVPSNDGNGSTVPMNEVINTELEDEDDIVVDLNVDNTVPNPCDNQNYVSNEMNDSNVDGFKVSDNEPNKVVNSCETHINDSNDIKNEIQINTSLVSTQENSVFMTQSLSSSTSPTDNTGAVYSNASGSQKSWADLFKKGSSGASIHNSLITSSNHSSSALISGPIVSQNYNSLNLSESDNPLNSNVVLNCESERCAQIQCIPMCNDPFARKLAKRVKEMNLKHYLPYLIPYGLVNRGNWCYINATLQALVGCPPFYNLMREIGETPGLFRERSSTPIIDSFAKFFTHFTPCEHLTRKQKAGANMSTEDMPKGEPIEPRCIYDVLGAIKSECLKGRQEDAEEFLSSVLNGLHEEMIALFKLLANDSEKQSLNGDHMTANGHIDKDENGIDLPDNDSNNDDDDSNLWKEVSSRHKAMPTRSAKVISTRIVDMFGGSTLSVRTAGKDICGNRQPFFTLQLDIQSDRVKSVEDALKCLTTSESIQGYMCPRTKQAMDASAQIFLDTLPPILILHLKLFVYDMDGGCRKLMKRIEYPVDLELPRECLHYDKWEREKNLQLKRYKLLSVVYHDGAEAIKGHYVTDVYHIGSNQWLRYDDGSVKVIPIQKVLNTETSRTPYLLFYRRFDTLYGKHSLSSNNSKTFSH